MKISDLRIEEYETIKGEEKKGLYFIVEGRVSFGLGNEDCLANFDVQKDPHSREWIVKYHGIFFRVDEKTAQNLKNHLSALKNDDFLIE